MRLSERIKMLLDEIKALENHHTPSNTLPQNTFYLNDNDILCCEREYGENRYPYSADGLTVWARASGYLESYESTFKVFKESPFSDDPPVTFFAGIPQGNGTFFPLSILGVGRQLFEPEGIKRYVVYSPKCAYYITETQKVTFAVRLFVRENKHIHFSFVALNKSAEEQKFYMHSSIETVLNYSEDSTWWDKTAKYGKLYDNGAVMLWRRDTACAVITKAAAGGSLQKEYKTVAKLDVLGGEGRTIVNALALKRGSFLKQTTGINTVDMPVSADMAHYALEPGEFVRRDYDLSYYFDMDVAKSNLCEQIDMAAIERELQHCEKTEKEENERLRITFGDWKGNLDVNLLNRFLKNVQQQVAFCALGKNFAQSFIGMRDVMQQIESCLIWKPQECREKIIVALNYILEDGRPPRQFSVPTVADMLPKMDLHKYIDQGAWIISTLYAYLAYTDDYSILDEKCTYYVASNDNTHIVAKSDEVTTVLEHLIRITDYLCSNIDTESGTNCLRALYGDWNDGVTGLGNTERAGREFGTGVSVMASLQFMQNLREMIEILSKLELYPKKIAEYGTLCRRLEEGLLKYAVDINEQGEKRILHGWGDERRYKIGSWDDPDVGERVSLTSHAYWAITGMVEKERTTRKSLLDAFELLDSKYGFKTFDKPFMPDTRKYVGLISETTPGSFENANVYVHAYTFAIMALFAIGESERAWKEFERVLVISHDNCSKTSFVMPNSYCATEEFGMDGNSTGDWYTGSATAVMKGLIKYGFGIQLSLDGFTLQTAKAMPCNKAQIDIVIKNHPITIIYNNKKSGKREFFVNGQCVSGEYASVPDTDALFVGAGNLADNMIIEIID